MNNSFDSYNGYNNRYNGYNYRYNFEILRKRVISAPYLVIPQHEPAIVGAKHDIIFLAEMTMCWMNETWQKKTVSTR